MNIKTAKTIAGTLSAPSKIPCKSYSLPANACKTGAKLRRIKGSVCAKCYACKGCYLWSSVKKALSKRLNSITHPKWIDAMTALIRGATKRIKYFRWHDSGDLQSIDHFVKICEIARRLPDVTFWLPTKEIGIINESSDDIPSNLVIRVSASMINGPAPSGVTHTSTCETIETQETCPATKPKSDKKCGNCRRCWDKNVKNVAYLLH